MSVNNLLTNNIVTFNALAVLENTNSMMDIINGEYSNEFTFGGAVVGHDGRSHQRVAERSAEATSDRAPYEELKSVGA